MVEVKKAIRKVKKQVITENYSLYQDDCCEAIKGIPDETVGHSVFSPPFASLYSYSDDPSDMGNARTYKEFFEHFSFLVRELQRVMIPGRVVAVHCMDLPTFKSREDFIGQRDFPGSIIRCFEREGFIYHARVCIWKDPLTAATRTHAIGLAHKQIIKDSSLCRTGIADYIVAFRKKGDNPTPVRNENGLTEYFGEEEIPRDLARFVGWKDQATNKRSHWIWQRYASPVWMDIRQGKVLPFKAAKEKEDQRHLCPLQTDVIERCLALWTTKGDVVLSPFAGVGSEIYVAVKNGRKAIGIELKRSYFRQMVRNMEMLKHQQKANKGFF